MTSITIGGSTPEQVLDVSTSDGRQSELGSCTIVLQDTATNRSVTEPGDPISITRNAAPNFTGYVTSEPSNSNGRLIVKGIESRIELKHETVTQVFYEQTRADAIRQLVQYRARPLTRTTVHTGSNANAWHSDAPVAERYGGTRAGLYDWGTDLVFVGARSGFDGTLRLTYDDVSASAIRDGIYELRTGITANDPGGIWDLEVELVTLDGRTYVWQPDLQSGSREYRLAAEQAHPDGRCRDTGVLQYRFTSNGQIAQNWGAFVDSAHTFPFLLEDRPSNIDPSGVKDTEGTIRRRVDDPAAVVVDDFATEDEATWWTDANDVLHYRPGTAPSSGLSIEAGQTPVTSVDVERDYESIRNVVTVEYGNGETVTVDDPTSVGFYGPVPRREPLQPGLETEDEAIEHGEGYLSEHAWDDALATFAIADLDYASLRAGERIDVTWPAESLDGSYVVDSVDAEPIPRGSSR